jgi:hypothetical protein
MPQPCFDLNIIKPLLTLVAAVLSAIPIKVLPVLNTTLHLIQLKAAVAQGLELGGSGINCPPAGTSGSSSTAKAVTTRDNLPLMELC